MLKKLENTAKEFTSLDDYLTVSVMKITKKLNELVDAHNELLDTHTVKGETATPDKKCHTAPMKKCKICKMDYCPECFEFCPMCPQPAVSDQHQKETATPDKQDGCCFCPCDCHQEKLPTSSYEVTCGRCEKSIKHSCGRV